MKNYWDGSICENGHIIDYGDGPDDDFCHICSGISIRECVECKTPIRGAEKISGWAEGYIKPADISFMTFPNYCHVCSSPYPWTLQILDNALKIISLDVNVCQDTKDIIKNAIPNLLVETPKSSLAIAEYQMNIQKFDKPIINAMKQLLFEAVSEGVKRTIFPS